MTDWLITPRDADLGRTFDPVSNWSELVLVERYGPPGSWVLKGPASALGVFTPGTGCILDRDGEQIVSGQVAAIGRVYQEDPRTGRVTDVMTVGFTEDTGRLWSRRCFPDPAHGLSSTSSQFSVSHDARTGARESILLGYIAANLGPAAPIAARRLASLVLPASLGRGGSTTEQARMDSLGDKVTDIAEAANLRVRVQHTEATGTPRLALTVEATTDRSADVVFGSAEVARATGRVTRWAYSYGRPETTAAIAFAAGELEERFAAMLVDTAAESTWGQRWETVVDQRQTDDPAVMTNAMQRELDQGAAPAQVEFTVAPGDLHFRTDFRLGDRVGVELPGLPLAVSDNRLREVVTTVKPRAPERLELVVGAPGATSTDTREERALARALARIAQLERGH